MRIVIIEDEKLTADDLAETILKIHPEIQIIAVLHSVKSAVTWFRKNEQPDLVFCDIQLGDGLSFEIFRAIPVNAPVIFCTAFDEYALKAFDANGIDYILKPFDRSAIEAAFNKYNKLKSKFSENSANIDNIIQLLENKRKHTQSSILVYHKDKIVPVRFDDIALFYIENEITHLLTFARTSYTINKSIEDIEKNSPDEFFRVNRQFLVNRKVIKEASQYFARKLSLTLTIPFKETITVSKIRVTDFLNWLSAV